MIHHAATRSRKLASTLGSGAPRRGSVRAAVMPLASSNTPRTPNRSHAASRSMSPMRKVSLITCPPAVLGEPAPRRVLFLHLVARRWVFGTSLLIGAEQESTRLWAGRGSSFLAAPVGRGFAGCAARAGKGRDRKSVV